MSESFTIGPHDEVVSLNGASRWCREHGIEEQSSRHALLLEIAAGHLRARRLNGQVVILVSDLEQFARARIATAVPQPAA